VLNVMSCLLADASRPKACHDFILGSERFRHIGRLSRICGSVDLYLATGGAPAVWKAIVLRPSACSGLRVATGSAGGLG
jgi:hypothetical protein